MSHRAPSPRTCTRSALPAPELERRSFAKRRTLPIVPRKNEPAAIQPEIGDHVIVPECTLLGGDVAVVVGFEGTRAVVRLERASNITVTLSRKHRVLPEYCTEHTDCVAHADLAVECARSMRKSAVLLRELP